MPKRVRIGNYLFEIEITELGDSIEAGEFGHMSAIDQMIYLSPYQNDQSVANTFIHEVIHAIHWVNGLFRNEPDEEQFTNQTANGLCQFFQDNPEATAWFLELNEIKQE